MLDEKSADQERERLFALIEQLVKWENINDETVLGAARLEIARSVARDLGVEPPVGKTAIRKFLEEKAPPVLDPFAGGGSIPLEAQRLGLRAYAVNIHTPMCHLHSATPRQGYSATMYHFSDGCALKTDLFLIH